jgi:hypothetical protein
VKFGKPVQQEAQFCSGQDNINAIFFMFIAILLFGMLMLATKESFC